MLTEPLPGNALIKCVKYIILIYWLTTVNEIHLLSEVSVYLHIAFAVETHPAMGLSFERRYISEAEI
jgi:hypothetical protein